MQKRWSIVVVLSILVLSQMMCSLYDNVANRMQKEISGNIQETMTVMQQTIDAAQNELPTLQSQVQKTVDAAQAEAPEQMEELQKTMQAMQKEFENIPEAASTQMEVEMSMGGLGGKLSYPSEFIPPLTIVAYQVVNGEMTGTIYWQDTDTNQTTYRFESLPQSNYYVVAYMQDYDNDMAAGYTEAVLCGLSVDCENHSLMEVEVWPGEVTEDIDLLDWYAPAGTYPSKPVR